MSRRNGNARPVTEFAPLDEQALEGEPTASVAVLVAARDHGTRSAAKHAPSRVTSRLYSQLHTVGQLLEDATAHLVRLNLPDDLRQTLEARVAAHHTTLAGVRAAVGAAGNDRLVADEVKARLGKLEIAARLLDPAIRALAYSARARAAAGSVKGAPAEVVRDLIAAEEDVLLTLPGDRPGRAPGAVARVRTLTSDLTAALR